MLSILLQTHVDGMSDVHFTLKDVIYILSIVVSFVIGYVGLKFAVKSLKEKLTSFIEAQEKKDKIIHDRINKTQEDMKEYFTKADLEFKEINKNLNTIIALVKK